MSRLRERISRYSVVAVASVALVASVAACSSSGGGGGGPSPALKFAASNWGSTWSYNPWSANFPAFGRGFVYAILAIQQPPKMKTFLPNLATSWKVSRQNLTIQLQPNAKWQNGSPLTSKDVVDTVALEGTAGNAVWNDLSGVKAAGKHAVTFTIRKGVPTAQAEADILALHPYPSSLYGKYVTPMLLKQDKTYYDMVAKNPNAGSNSPAKKAMDKIFANLLKFKPKKMLGDGAYKLITMNTQQAKLVKSKNYFNASKIHVPNITYVTATNKQGLYGRLTSGRLDFAHTYMPAPIVNKYIHTPDAHVVGAPWTEYDILFNDHKYPLTLTKVRQALAYAIPRKDMISAAYGTVHAGGVIEDHPDGLTPAVEKVWLTQEQIAQLNTYPHNLTKAASLLESVGFTKNGKQWMTPKGKSFNLKMVVNVTWSDIMTAFKTAAGALTDFGIKTSVTSESGAEYAQDLHSGNFDVALALSYDLNPLKEFDKVLGTSQNFSASGNYKGQRGIGYGPMVDVPGLGKVNVPETIDHQASSVSPGPKMKKLVWDWVRLVNQDVPYLQFGNKVVQLTYSTARYTNWPPKNSKIWNLFATNLQDAFPYAEQQGYIQPKQ